MVRTSLIQIVALTIAVGACSRGADPDSAGGDLPCGGKVSSTQTLSDRVGLVFLGTFSGDSTRGDSLNLDLVFIGRGARGWKQQQPGQRSLARPVLPESVGFLSGGSIGELYMGHERGTNVAWVHDQKIVIDSFNVILVDRVDSAGGPPMVVGKLRVPSHVALQPGTCGKRAQPGGLVWMEAVRAALLKSPEIRAFAGS